MKISISLVDSQMKSEIINLKKFVERHSIDGMDSLEIQSDEINQGEMGDGGIITSIVAI